MPCRGLAPCGDEHERARQGEVVSLAIRRETCFDLVRRARRARRRPGRRRRGGSGRSRPPGPASTRPRPARCARSCSAQPRRRPGPLRGGRSRPRQGRRASRRRGRRLRARARAPSAIASRGTPNHGFSAGEAQSTVTSRPPGPSTRRNSRSVATGSSAAISASRLVTASNDASANGNGPLKSASSSVSSMSAAAGAAPGLRELPGASCRSPSPRLPPARARPSAGRCRSPRRAPAARL